MFGRVQKSKFAKDKSGATIIYVTMIMAVLIGMAGMAVDFSRLYIAHSQAQAAADAAAIAAANQLDGSVEAINRAEDAAEAAMLVANKQDFAEESSSKVRVNVTLRFLTSLPPDDDTPIDYATLETTNPNLAEFAEATTEILTHRNVLLPFLNIAGKKPLRAQAIAAQNSAICRVTPLAICNPNETAGNGEDFDIDQWIGKQIKVVQKENGNDSWAPGNFGFLDPPVGAVTSGMGMGNGAPVIGELLAQKEGANACFSTALNTRTGAINAVRTALNTRWDIYEVPHFGNPNSDYPPAMNVTKGWTAGAGMGMGGPECNMAVADPVDPTVMGLPRDAAPWTDFPGGPGSGGRVGSGNWDCAAYWNMNHDGEALPAGPEFNFTTCDSSTSAADDFTRYEMYLYEIEENHIPGTGAHTNVENGEPGCYNSANPALPPYPFTRETDRRLVHFAVMNCLAEGVKGNSDNVPAKAFIKAFMTEPIDGVDFDVYLEIIDVFIPGTNNGPLKEFVEIVR